METVSQTFAVDGMTCAGCARSVRAALLGIDGVVEASADHEAASATMRAQREISRETVAAALEEAGFTLQ